MMFTLLDGSQKNPPMMSRLQPCYLSYLRTNDFEAVSLPYRSDRMSMYVFLPDKQTTLADFLSKLTVTNWQQWMSQFTRVQGTVVLPRFKFGYAVSLKEALGVLGMEIAFDRRRANFQHISSTRPIWMSEVKQKAFVEVNEKGTEAAAITHTCISWGGSPEQPFMMIVDRPFFFTIRDNETGTVLFMGVVVDPK